MHRVCAGGNSDGAPSHVDYGWVYGRSSHRRFLGLRAGSRSAHAVLAYRLAEQRRWDVSVSAVATTGWTTAGFCGERRNYMSRVATIPVDADVVLIEGGLNDVESDDLQRHAAATLAAIRKRAPAAEIVVVAPPHVRERRRGDTERVTRQLGVAAADARVRFVSTSRRRAKMAWPAVVGCRPSNVGICHVSAVGAIHSGREFPARWNSAANAHPTARSGTGEPRCLWRPQRPDQAQRPTSSSAQYCAATPQHPSEEPQRSRGASSASLPTIRACGHARLVELLVAPTETP